MKSKRINYDELTVTCIGEPSKESLKNYYNLLIDCLIKEYGKDAVRMALDQIINDYNDERR